MALDGAAAKVCAAVGVAGAVIVAVYNFARRAVVPSSIMQYTYLSDDGKRYTLRVLSKKRSGFYDGKYNLEVERGEGLFLEKMPCERFVFDFFANMDIAVRIVKDGREIFKGRTTVGGKTYPCKIAFDGDRPLYGTVGGGRIKYFDINDTSHKFLIPTELKTAAKSANIFFPKIPGVHVKDDITNVKKR